MPEGRSRGNRKGDGASAEQVLKLGRTALTGHRSGLSRLGFDFPVLARWVLGDRFPFGKSARPFRNPC